MKERTISRTLRGLASGLTLAMILVVASPPSAAAERAAVIVTGKASEHDRSIVASAVGEAVGKASWTVDARPFKPTEVDSIVKCLQNDRPWRCIEPLVNDRQLDRLVIIQVDLKALNAPALYAQLLSADDRIPPEETRFCERCTDATLIALTHDVMGALFRRANELPVPHTDGATTLSVNTVPPGATIWIDGRAAGKAGEHLSIAAGHHVIDVELDGHEREQRTIDAKSDRAQTLDVELHPNSAGSSKKLPIALIAGGGALAAGCVVYGFTLDPPNTREQDRVLVSWPAVGGAVVGAFAIGVGVYLLLRHGDGDKPRSSPTASLVTGGAVLGWSRSFN